MVHLGAQIQHLEFKTHPMMREEELLASRLLALFTAYKQRAAANMVQFYEDRLLGLEDSLLETRHELLSLQVPYHRYCLANHS